MKNFKYLFFVVVLLSIGFIYYFLKPKGIEIDENKYPIKGIDISKHTGEIDTSKLKKYHFDFVFFKATEGASYKDERFEENYLKLRGLQIPISVYHLYRIKKPWLEQANNFLRAIKGKKIELPLIIDIETWVDFFTPINNDDVNGIRQFINYVQADRKTKMIIYCNKNDYDHLIKSNFTNDVWLCTFDTTIVKNYPWTFWQYSHKGKFDFANEQVDINTFNGNDSTWKVYCNQHS
jgi:lysozyme